MSDTSESRPQIAANPRVRTRGHIEEFGEGRVCADPGCDTVLSRYNRSALCARHEPFLTSTSRLQ